MTTRGRARDAGARHWDRAARDLPVADRLHSAAIHLLRRLRKQDEAAGLGAARLSALSVVVFGGPLTLGELAAAEQVRPPTMTRIVAGLEEAGLVARETDARDRRVMRVRATGRGRRLMEEGRRRRISYLAARLKSLPPGDVRLLEKATALIERLAREG